MAMPANAHRAHWTCAMRTLESRSSEAVRASSVPAGLPSRCRFVIARSRAVRPHYVRQILSNERFDTHGKRHETHVLSGARKRLRGGADRLGGRRNSLVRPADRSWQRIRAPSRRCAERLIARWQAEVIFVVAPSTIRSPEGLALPACPTSTAAAAGARCATFTKSITARRHLAVASAG